MFKVRTVLKKYPENWQEVVKKTAEERENDNCYIGIDDFAVTHQGLVYEALVGSGCLSDIERQLLALADAFGVIEDIVIDEEPV